MSNMFDNAKKTEAKPAKGKKSKGREVAVKNLNQLASIKAVLAALEGVAKTTVCPGSCDNRHFASQVE